MPVRKGNSIDFLTVKDASDLRKKSSVSHLKTLYGLIEDVEKRIHVAASSGLYDLVYSVPVYHTELPLYNQPEMRDELVQHFKRHGFYVLPINQSHVQHTSFYISWLRPESKPVNEYPKQPQTQPRPRFKPRPRRHMGFR